MKQTKILRVTIKGTKKEIKEFWVHLKNFYDIDIKELKGVHYSHEEEMMQKDKISKLIDKIMPCSSCIYAYKERGSSASDCPKCNYKEDLVDQIKQYARDEWVLNTKQINYALKRVRFNEESILLDSVKDSERVILCGSVRKRLAKAIHTKMRERIK